jgi:hypothetical protein
VRCSIDALDRGKVGSSGQRGLSQLPDRGTEVGLDAVGLLEPVVEQ